MPRIPGTNANVYLEEDRKKTFDEYYQKKVTDVHPSVDNKAPKELKHIHDRGKQRFEERQRQQQIDADNANLLKRIEYQYTEAKGLNTRLVQNGPKSLNRGRREDELKRITEENRRLHKAIVSQKPMINIQKMDNDYNKHKYYALLKQRNPDVFLSEERTQTLLAHGETLNEVKGEIQTEILDVKQKRLAEIGQIQIVEREQPQQEQIENDLYIQEMAISQNFDNSQDNFTGDQVYVTKEAVLNEQVQ